MKKILSITALLLVFALALTACDLSIDMTAQAEEVVSHVPQIIDGTWWIWDAEAEEYVDTGEQVFDDPPEIEFDIDPETGELIMTYPTGYGGPEVAITDDGYLEVTYGG